MNAARSTGQAKTVKFVLVLLTVIVIGGVAGNLVYVTWIQEKPTGTDAEAPVATPLNTPRPEFTLRDLDGIPRTVGSWDGKVLVLNFWATWCKPCLREIPTFNRLQNEHGDAGLQFVGIAIDDRDAVREFMKTTTIDYPVLAAHQAAIEVAQEYGNDVGVLPYTAVVDRSGNIAFVQFGEFPEDLARTVILPLL